MRMRFEYWVIIVASWPHFGGHATAQAIIEKTLLGHTTYTLANSNSNYILGASTVWYLGVFKDILFKKIWLDGDKINIEDYSITL